MEVGSHRGANALSIINTLTIKKIFLIDPYAKYSQHMDFKYVKNDFINYREIFKISMRDERKNKNVGSNENYIFINTLFKNNNNVKIIRDTSVNTVINFQDNSLDFVYIDGAHDYDNVYNDLSHWYPKIKSDGIICGHDTQIIDVLQAAIDFAVEKNLKLLLLHPDYVMKSNKR